MNFAFIFTIIRSQLLIFCLPLQCLSACSSSHHNGACPFNFVKACLTFLSSSGPMSPETLMSRILMNPWLLHCMLCLKPCATSFRPDGCQSFASSSHKYKPLISFPLEIFVSRTLRHDPSTGCKVFPLLALSPSTSLQVLNPSNSVHFLQQQSSNSFPHINN